MSYHDIEFALSQIRDGNVDNVLYLATSNDKYVRMVLAHAGYALDLLVDDPSYDVRKEVFRYFAENKTDMLKWSADHPDRVVGATPAVTWDLEHDDLIR